MAYLSTKLLAFLLLTTVAAVTLTGQDASLMIAAGAPSAGCHQHDPAPVPKPVSYRCCQSGHDSAILQSSLASRLDSAELPSTFEARETRPIPVTYLRLRDLTISSADPPDITPLRV